MAVEARFVMGASAALLSMLLPGCVSEAARRQGIVGTKVSRWGVASRLELEHERTDQRARDAQRQRMVTAGIDVDADVSVYDPRLLSATIAATIAQSWAKARGPIDGSDTASVPRYYARADVTRDRAVSGYAVAERDDDRSFSRARFIRSSIEREEAGIRARSTEYSGYLTVRQSTSDVRGIDPSGDRTIDSRYLSAGAEHVNARSRTSVDLNMTDLEESPNDRDDRTRQIDILNQYKSVVPGSFPEFRFRTGAQLWHQKTNGQTLDRERYFENVAIELSDTLSSHSNVEYHNYSNGNDTENREVSQEFVHRLFDSVVTSVGAFRSRDDFDEGDVKRSGTSAALDYRKDIVIGELRAGLDVQRERQKDDFEGQELSVFAERVLLQTARTVYLKQLNVLHDTVVVRDAGGVINYVEGVDYDLRRRSSRTEIRRIATGLIPDGSIVQVDYRYESAGDSEFETRTRTGHVGLQLFDTVTLFTRKSRQRQQDLSNSSARDLGDTGTSIFLEDTDTTTYGAELDLGDLRLTGEKERHRSDLSPYDERRSSVTYDIDVTDWARVTAFTTRSRTEYEEGEDSRVLSYGATFTLDPARRLRIEAQPVWQEERGRGEDKDILDLRARATYSIGKIDVELLVDSRSEEQDGRRVSDTRIILSVVREW